MPCCGTRWSLDSVARCPPQSKSWNTTAIELGLRIFPKGTVTLTLAVELMCYHSPMHTVSYHRHRFPAEAIQHAVWLYFRFPLSFRDVVADAGEPLKEQVKRGVDELRKAN
jgi:hypothetical protein